MKKGLLSILAGALLVVGCQNYDDQFDTLETQINALASTVAGLSQVQSQLAALTTTVASVQSALASIPSGSEINAAVSEGLAGVQADIDALETALDNVVSADDLTAVSDAIDNVADDVSDILASNNVYSQELIITNQAELDIATGLGGKVALINNNVTIVLSDDMNLVELDSVTSKMTAIVGAFKYSADAKDFEETQGHFPKLKSVSKGFEYATRAPISLPALTSVGSLLLSSGDSELVTSIDLSALEKLPYVQTGTTADAISFSDAASLKLGKLVRYTGGATASQMTTVGTAGTLREDTNTLSITLDDDDATSFDLAALTTEDPDDEDTDIALALTIAGPRTVALTNYAKGVLTANDATTVTLPDYEWNALTSLDDVETLAVHKVATSMTLSLTNFPDLTTLDARNAVYEVKSPADVAISISGNTNVESVSLDGYFSSFDATGASSLDTLTTAGEVGTFILTSSDIDDLVLGHAAWRTSAGYPVATLEIEDNTKLTSITADSLDDINELHIVNNDKLATISMAKLTAPSTKATESLTAATPGVAPVIGAKIYGNAKLTATHQKASAAGALTAVAQSVTLDQVPTSVITWIKAAKAVWGTTGYGDKGQASQADGTFYIAVDEHTEVAADGTETELTSLVVANLYGAETTNAINATYAKRSFNLGSTDGAIFMGVDTDGTIGTGAKSAFEIQNNTTTTGLVAGSLLQTVTNFISDTSALYSDNGLSLSVAAGGNPTAKIDFLATGTTSLTAGDLVYLTVGGNKLVSNDYSGTATTTYAFEVPWLGTTSNTKVASDTALNSLVSSMTTIIRTQGNGANSVVHSGTHTSTAGAFPYYFTSTAPTNRVFTLGTTGADDNKFDNTNITISVKTRPTTGDYSTAASTTAWIALPLWKKESLAVAKSITNFEDRYYQINETDSKADDKLQGSDVILTLTALDAGTLSVIGQPGQDYTAGAAANNYVLAGSVTLTVGATTNAVSNVTAEIMGNSTASSTIYAAQGIGTTTADAKKAAILTLNQTGYVVDTTKSTYGYDGTANTNAAAGTTPDLISKLSGI